MEIKIEKRNLNPAETNGRIQIGLKEYKYCLYQSLPNKFSLYFVGKQPVKEWGNLPVLWTDNKKTETVYFI